MSCSVTWTRRADCRCPSSSCRRLGHRHHAQAAQDDVPALDESRKLELYSCLCDRSPSSRPAQGLCAADEQQYDLSEGWRASLVHLQSHPS